MLTIGHTHKHRTPSDTRMQLILTDSLKIGRNIPTGLPVKGLFKLKIKDHFRLYTIMFYGSYFPCVSAITGFVSEKRTIEQQ